MPPELCRVENLDWVPDIKFLGELAQRLWTKP